MVWDGIAMGVDHTNYYYYGIRWLLERWIKASWQSESLSLVASSTNHTRPAILRRRAKRKETTYLRAYVQTQLSRHGKSSAAFAV